MIHPWEMLILATDLRGKWWFSSWGNYPKMTKMFQVKDFFYIQTSRHPDTRSINLVESFSRYTSEYINGNSRILNWRYCTIFLAIFWGDIPLHGVYQTLSLSRNTGTLLKPDTARPNVRRWSPQVDGAKTQWLCCCVEKKWRLVVLQIQSLDTVWIPKVSDFGF